MQQGKWKHAQKLCLDVVERAVAVLGPQHENTLAFKVNLAMIYNDQHYLEEAQSILQESC